MDGAGLNHRHLHAFAELVHFFTQTRSGGGQRKLGHRIRHQKRHGQAPGNRADKQHRAALARNHAAQRQLRERQGGKHIDLKHPANALHVHLGQRARFAHAGVVQQHVHRPVQHLRAIKGVGDVELVHLHHHIAAGGLGAQRISLRQTEGGGQHAVAARGQGKSGVAANAGARAGDQNGFFHRKGFLAWCRRESRTKTASSATRTGRGWRFL